MRSLHAPLQTRNKRLVGLIETFPRLCSLPEHERSNTSKILMNDGEGTSSLLSRLEEHHVMALDDAERTGDLKGIVRICLEMGIKKLDLEALPT